MKIALDYDGTYTAAPVLFDAFIAAARQQGHEVYLVTGRLGTPRIDGIERAIVVPYGEYKLDVCRHAGLRIDIWIDDLPQLIAPAVGILSWKEQS